MGTYLNPGKTSFEEAVNSEIFIDKTGKAEGRGIYICNDVNCLEKIIKNNKLEKVLQIKIDNDIYEKLRGVIIGE